MSKLVSLLVCLITILAACSNNELKGKKPPEAEIVASGKHYETVLGTYCWSNGNSGKCVDTIGPKDLLELKGKKAIPVQPGEEVVFMMDYTPQPNEVHLEQLTGDTPRQVPVRDGHFKAPTEKGIYYYSYGVWWMDEKEKNVSNGDAFYSFALEVE
ncbi:hypothetical protein [Peribacillus deserti]|uniref:Lipoprotein n=1 Tax=Peribacillus deserti TaxID=673318 RepID=A0A2N5M527_9BACI|nr:hypothetical protein [Peribacillus deserti]PLT29459.1 hypothetical protein CUU66_12800 [Peribacillus deserti]